MVKGTTKSGFEFEIDETRLDDYEFIEMLSDIEEDMTIFPKVARKILGVKQHNALKEHLRDENGIVPATAFEAEITEILSYGNENTLKN